VVDVARAGNPAEWDDGGKWGLGVYGDGRAVHVLAVMDYWVRMLTIGGQDELVLVFGSDVVLFVVGCRGWQGRFPFETGSCGGGP
jgi:hypothetical protein